MSTRSEASHVRVAIVSDTHVPRFAKRLDSALAHVAAERPDLIVHCGDLTALKAVAAFEAIAPVRAVAGNNDGPEIVARFGRRTIVRIAGVAIGAVHGDGSPGTTLGRALAAFAGETVDAIVFGHSHVPYCRQHAGVWVVNPGSPTDKRRQPLFSFAILDIALGVCSPRLVTFAA